MVIASKIGVSLARLNSPEKEKSGRAPPTPLLLFCSQRISPPNFHAWLARTQVSVSRNSYVFCAKIAGVFSPRGAPKRIRAPAGRKPSTSTRGIPRSVSDSDFTWSVKKRVKLNRASLIRVAEIVRMKVTVADVLSGSKNRSAPGLPCPSESLFKVSSLVMNVLKAKLFAPVT